MGINIEYEEIESVLEQILGNPISFENMVNRMISEGTDFSMGKWMKMLGNILLQQLRDNGRNIGYLCLLILSAAVLATIAKAFKSRQISDMGFYMIFLMMFLILMKSFGACYELTASVITDLTDFMKVLMPAYLMAAAVSAYRITAVAYYEGFLLLV